VEVRLRLAKAHAARGAADTGAADMRRAVEGADENATSLSVWYLPGATAERVESGERRQEHGYVHPRRTPWAAHRPIGYAIACNRLAPTSERRELLHGARLTHTSLTHSLTL
jgi:hypothetical protein